MTTDLAVLPDSPTKDKGLHPTMLIDPEDIAINYNINNRGYNVRCSVYRSSNLIADDWRTFITNLADSTILMSIDRKDIKGKTYDVGTFVYDLLDAILVVYVPASLDVYFHVWTNSYETASRYCDEIEAKLFVEKIKDVFDEQKVSREITFWGSTGSDYSSFHRRTTLLNWNDSTRSNYPAGQLEQMDNLINLTPPLFGGKIILLHGAPGTGKTSFIRAISRQWTHWCHTSYVTDPDVFLGLSGAMLNVVTWRYESYIQADVLPENAYHLVVLEDVDELIDQDAKRRSGQALSRLLNLGDGVLGQSSNLLLCLTTNVPMEQLHGAVSRAGRCMAQIEFKNFTLKEANEWLRYHNISEEDISKIERKNYYSLAELYQIGSNFKQLKTVKDDSPLPGVYI